MDSDARSLAMNRLSAKEYAAGEMKRYLRRKGVEKEEAQKIVDELVEKGLISDSRFSSAMAREQANRGKGPRFLQLKLMQKGIRLNERQTKELFETAVPEAESEIIDRVLERRYPALIQGAREGQIDRKLQQRAFQGLLRRGFSSDTVKAAMKRVLSSKGPIDT
jgi:SOS response regulatory protein OraA/RecX